MEHLNVGWNPKVLILLNAGIIDEKDRGKYHNPQKTQNPEKWDINKLYEEGHHIKYWTARGAVTKLDWLETTTNQLNSWGCQYHELSVGEKPDYDLLICDKTKRIEEI